MIFIDFIIKKFRFIGLAIIVGIVLHGLLGKPRWQHYPLYILALIYFVLVILNSSKLVTIGPNISKGILIIGGILIFLSLALLLIFPLEELPIPSGRFEIGTRIYDLEDKGREEIYSGKKEDKRKIKYQIWYPAQEVDRYKKARWIGDGSLLTRQLASSMHLPAFMLDHTVKIDSNSYDGSPISDNLDKYPLVIISHGWKGFRELHTDYAEELASNGFIAVSIDHTYGSQAVKFKDGSVAYLEEEALPSQVDPSKYNENSNKLVRTYGEDVASTIDDLEKLNTSDGDFQGRLDLDSLGLLGHSTGGGGDVYISLKDKRIKALLGLDAWVNPLETEKLKKGLPFPLLFIRSQQWSRGPNNNGLTSIVENSKNASLMQLNKTNHVDFSMSYMYSPLTKYIGFTGELGGRKSSEIQREIILDFFNETLRNDNIYKEDYLVELKNKYEPLEFVEKKQHFNSKGL